MFNFGKKKTGEAAGKKEEIKVNLTVIPEIFYGGKDPLIYHEQKATKVEKKKMPEKQLKIKVVPPFSRKKVIVIFFVILGMVGGAAAWAYLNKISEQEGGIMVKLGLKEKPASENVLPPPPQLPKNPPPTPVPPEPTPPEPTPPEPVVPTPIEPKPLSFPRILLSDSPDLDMDSLTDLEEEVFNTDSGVWDNDKDGYYDGQEVSNLYNPAGFAPVKIIDSGLVREYSNPTWKYRLYYPATWEVANVDPKNEDVLFSSIAGDFVEVRVIKNEQNEAFNDWFVKNISGQRIDDLVFSKNRFEVEFRKRNDSLVAYFVGDRVVYVMIYQPVGEAMNLPFRHIIQMMAQSFRVDEVFTDLPAQKPLPSLPTENIENPVSPPVLLNQ